MIRYALKCGQSHSFESWFQSAAAFETLKAAGHVSCPTCGEMNIEKAIMAPQISKKSKAQTSDPAPQAPAPALSSPQSGAEVALAKIKAHIQANSDDVGMNFATEARAIHEGEAPERAIYGQAKPEDAKALIEDGIPVAALPFLPNRKMN